jgi:hypothetical protein
MLVAGSLIGLTVLTVVAAFAWIQAQRPAIEALHFFRCWACGQKLRYDVSKAGRTAMCPRCRQRATLPRESRDQTLAEASRGMAHLRVGQRRMLAR